MQSLSSLLGKSKKQSVFRQAYIMSVINKGLDGIQLISYPYLKVEFERMEKFIIPGNNNDYKINLRIYDSSFKTFIKTEISNIDFLLQQHLTSIGLDKLKFEIAVS